MKKILFVLFLLPIAVMAQKKSKNSAVEKPVLDFLKWYQKHQAELKSINLVFNFNQTESSNKPYSIDYKSTEKYLTELKKSGLIGAKYVERWRNYFKKCDADFLNNPQTEGVPVGFEHDLILLTKDDDVILNTLEALTVKDSYIKSNGYALVTIQFSNKYVLKFELSKQNDTWYIQDISN